MACFLETDVVGFSSLLLACRCWSTSRTWSSSGSGLTVTWSTACPAVLSSTTSSGRWTKLVDLAGKWPPDRPVSCRKSGRPLIGQWLTPVRCLTRSLQGHRGGSRTGLHPGGSRWDDPAPRFSARTLQGPDSAYCHKLPITARYEAPPPPTSSQLSLNPCAYIFFK